MAIDTYARASSRKQTDQSHPIPGREAQMVENSAGGYVFHVNDWTRLRRFLTLGSERGSYYVGQQDLTRANCHSLERCIAVDGLAVLREIVEVSTRGLAPKNDPAIFALALCLKTGDLETRRAAADAVPAVCRIGTHLFQLATCVDALGGWGRLTRKAFADWYRTKTPKNLALQVVKYRQRDGWTHRDILRLAHPHPASVPASLLPIVAWAAGKGETMADPFIHGFEQAQAATDPAETARLVRKYTLPRECVKTEHLGSKEVWAALLERMPLMAMVRNLGKMTSIGLLKPFSVNETFVTSRLRDREVIRKSKIHPIQLLLALKTYAQGHGIRGSLSWTRSALVIDALDQAYGWAFENVEPSGKRHLLALDVSGSMGAPAGGTVLTCAEAGAAMLMATIRAELASHAVAFSDGGTGGGWGGHYGVSGSPGNSAPIVPFPVSARERLDDVLQRTRALTFGRTDCSAPMRYALEQELKVDVFVIYTDNETWYGDIHPAQALQEYRRKTGIPAKLVVVAMTATGTSIADPNDAGMLDVSGFDASVPAVLADFARS